MRSCCGARLARCAAAVTGIDLLLLLDHPLELRRHFRDGLPNQLHLPIRAPPHQDIEPRTCRILLRTVVAEVPATALPPLDRGAGHRLGDRQQVAQVERGVPTRIVLAVAGHTYPPRS